MKWVLIIAGVLAVLVAVVLLIGTTLPQNHTASRAAHFNAPADSVWALITDVEQYPSWRRELDSVEVIQSPDGKLTWREVSGSDKITFEAMTMERPSRFVARITDKGLQFGGSWDYHIEPDGSGSRITITENGEVYNPVFRFVSRYVMGHTATLDKYLKSLAAKLGDGYAAPAG
jgi:uncharacterized protein YndB with AHSA1/START domain